MKSIRCVFFSALALLVAVSAFAEYNSRGIPDSSQIRKEINGSWLKAPLKTLREKQPEIRTNSIGQRFQIWLMESSLTFSILVAPEKSMTFGSGADSQTVSDFPADSPGAWLIERRIDNGKPVRIRWYFVQDEDVFVQFSPDPLGGKKTLADYVIGGCYAARNVPVGISFENLYTASFSKVFSVTEKTLPWHYSEIYTGQYASKLYMMKQIRKNLSRITLEPNASYDEDAQPVHTFDGSPREVVLPSISDVPEGEEPPPPPLTLDSNGFTKWIIDALSYPISGSGIRIPPLLQRTVEVSPLSYAGVRGQAEDLSFSLDWTRNLALARLSVQTKKVYLYDSSGVDVKIEPFSAEITPSGIKSLSGYLKDSGYNSQYLRQVLYVLGVTEPTYFYLAAVRKSLRPGVNPAAGKNAEIYTFEDSAVIFPYFDGGGRFDCKVFYEGRELSLASFIEECGDCFVHLTRVLASDRFFLR